MPNKIMPNNPETQESSSDESREDEIQGEALETGQEKLEVEPDIETPFERMTLEKEEREIEKHEAEIELGDKTKEKAEEFLKQEYEDRHNEFAIKWFKEHQGELKDEGEPIDVSDERKIEIAAKNKAFRELMEKKEYEEEWAEIENISAIIADFKDGRVSPDGLSLALNFLQGKAEKAERDLKTAERGQDALTVSQKQRELDELFPVMQEMAEKISGRDLRREAGNKRTIKEWEEVKGYLSYKKGYIKENYERLGGEFKDRLINGQIENIRNRGDLTTEEKEKKIEKIKNKDYTRELADELLGYQIQKKGTIRKRFEVIDKSGGPLIRTLKKENEAIQFLKEKTEEKLKEMAGEEWTLKNNEREAEIRKLVGKEIRGLAKSPEKAEQGVETVYSRLKERLISEFIENKLKEEKKTREDLRRIEKEFKGKGKNPTEFISDVLHRGKGLEDLKGDLGEEGSEDEGIIEDFLEEWGIPVESDRMKKFLNTEKGKEYRDVVGSQKSFLDWLLDLIFFFLVEEDKKQGEEKKRRKQGGKNKGKDTKKINRKK
ncbi:MAG: hypothetical protein FJZ07_00615 [Candidatus Nealsonbacteria bacterium]|nr:hypothetical protein [Candidatus Nealsonbacteria bacterium]